jgi:O-antigen/teichoic acid export membrane protein
MLSNFARLYRHANSRKGHIVRTLAADSKRSFWAMADQGVVSLGNFGVNIVLVDAFNRQHDLSSFGSFWILMELMIFLNGIQGALINYPLIVRGAVLDRPQLGRMASASSLTTILASPILSIAIVIAAIVARIPLLVGIWAAVALAIWQVQETLRRALISQLRFRSALVGDSLSYLGQVGAVMVLAHRGNLTLANCFQAMAITSALAALVQASQVGLHPVNFVLLRDTARDSWKLGRWILVGNLSGFFVGPAFNWNFAFWRGKELLGIHYALTNLLRLANPLSFSIATLIVPSVARANKHEGLHRASRILLRLGCLGLILLTPYLGIMVLAPRLMMSTVYSHWDPSYLRYAGALQIAAIAAGVNYLAVASGAFLNGLERGRWTMVSQIAGAVTVVVIAMPLVARYGVFGAAVGALASAGVELLFNASFILKLKAHPTPQQAPP